MALSRITKIAPGGSNTFAVAFALGYGNEDDVTARVGAEVDGLGDPVYRTIDFSVAGFMTLDGATIAADTEVVFDRTVSREALVVDWSDGSNVTDENLDAAQLQALRLIHEVADGRFEPLTQDVDANGFKIVGAGEPTADSDVATKGYVDATIISSGDPLAAAEIARDLAIAAAAAAAISESSADADAATVAGSVATAAANAVSTAADVLLTNADVLLTGADAVATAADRVAVAADKVTVAADKAIVAADKGTVSTDKGIVAADKATVSSDKSLAIAAADDAVAAQVAAEAALASTLAAYDSFDDRYLGTYAVDPTLDNDGAALVAGMIYFDSAGGAMKVYTGSAWTAAYVSGGGVPLLANNGSDYTAATFRTNLDLYSTAQIDGFAVKLTGTQTVAGVKTFSSIPVVPAASWPLASLVNLAGLSVLGRSANTTGVQAAITAGVDGDILRRSGTSIGFGTILAASVSDFSTAADARVSAAIGVTVQAYAAALGTWGAVTRAAGFDTFAATPTSANLLALVTDETGTGALVFGTSPTLVTPVLTTPALTNPVITGTIKEDIFTITDAAGFAIDPANGSTQFITLGASRTPVASGWDDGEEVTLQIADGTAYAITWSTVGVVWKSGTAPTLAATGYTEVSLKKSGGVIRGVHIGDFAS